MNLINVLKEIRRQILSENQRYETEKKKLEIEHNKIITDLETAYRVNSELNTTCLICEGKGIVEVPNDSTADSHYHTETCPACNGSGKN